MRNLLLRIKNFFIYGKYSILYTVSFSCNKVIGAAIVEADDKEEAAMRAREQACGNNKMLDFRIIEIKEL